MKAVTIEFKKVSRVFPFWIAGGQAWFDGRALVNFCCPKPLFCDETFRQLFHIPLSVRRVSMRVSLRRFKGGRMVRVQKGALACPRSEYRYTLRPFITPRGELLHDTGHWIEKNIRPLPPDGPVLTLWVSVTAKEKGA